MGGRGRGAGKWLHTVKGAMFEVNALYTVDGALEFVCNVKHASDIVLLGMIDSIIYRVSHK